MPLLCAQPLLAGGAFEQLQHVLVGVAGRLRHALLTGAVRRNVCGGLAPSLYIETTPFAATSCGGGGSLRPLVDRGFCTISVISQ